MKTSLRFKEPMEIKTNGRVKIEVNGAELALADIPAIRYAFGNDETGETGWLTCGENGNVVFNGAGAIVKYNRETLTKSLHIVELNVGHVDMASMVNGIRQMCGKVAIFLYVDFSGYNEKFDADLQLAANAFDLVDRIMIREKTIECLMAADVHNLMKYVKQKMGDVKTNKIGICDSPVGCSLGLSCLSAALCRELSAKYGDDIDMVVPSQNHEGMSGAEGRACNCIGFVDVHQLKALDANKGGFKKGNKSTDRQSGSDTEQNKKKKAASSKNVVLKW